MGIGNNLAGRRWGSIRSVSIILFSIPFLSVCERGVPPNGDSEFEVRDSAGVQIVLNGPIGALGEDTLRLEEDFRIGEIEGENHLLFYRIGDIAMGERGTLFVGNSQTGTVRVFSPEGAFLREFGGRGEGPGEVTRFTALWVQGDSVVVVDRSRAGKTIVFTRNGELVSTWRIRRPNNSQTWPSGFGPGGWVGIHYPPPEPFQVQPGERHEQDSDLVRLFLGEDSVGEVVVDLPAAVFYGLRSGQGADFPLFFPEVWFDFDGNGNVFLSRGHPYEIDVFDSWGTLIRSVRRIYDAIPITEDHVRNVIEGIGTPLDTLSGVTPESRAREKERLIEQVAERASFPRLDVLPPLRRLMVAQDGAFWIERIDGLSPVEPEIHRTFGISARSGSHSVWDIYNKDGRFQGTVVLPPRFTPMAVEERAVVGVEVDSLDVEYVVRFGVRSNQSP